jgi:nicotinate-nucleotide adenylyltransferase
VTAAAVGILGGTFNPPHLGHLVMAQEARDQLGLDRVVLMPAGVPPHKDVVGADPGAAARLELCRLAAAGDDGVAVCDVEMRRAGPSFTVDTLRVLHERDPELDLTFIVGGDMAETLPSWREPEGVLGLARLAVAERSGMPRLDISSSDIRERVAGGRPIRHLVPDAVAAEIAAHGYYRPRSGSPVA